MMWPEQLVEDRRSEAWAGHAVINLQGRGKRLRGTRRGSEQLSNGQVSSVGRVLSSLRRKRAALR